MQTWSYITWDSWNPKPQNDHPQADQTDYKLGKVAS